MQTQDAQARRLVRHDTFDLRDQIHSDDHSHQGHPETTSYHSTSDEEHSVLEDDSDGEERDADYMDEDDDGSSSLSIPNESIDFDLVYSLHSFAATVEGQANVVKGDSLFLMDDSNSYWWLVRVLKTQEVGYIPAENIETPFERLARLNKHRNVDLASATQAELQEDVHVTRDRMRTKMSSRAGSNQPGSPSPSPIPPGTNGESRSTSANRSRQAKGVSFTAAFSVHRYPPAVWGEEEEEEEGVEWDDEAYEDEDPDLVDEQQQGMHDAPMAMEPDDGMGWDDSIAEEMQNRNVQAMVEAEQQQQLAKARQEQQQLLAQQQQQQDAAKTVRLQTSRERLSAAPNSASDTTPSPTSPSRRIDPAEVTETRKVTVTPSIAREEQPTVAQAQQNANGPLLPSAIMQKQDEDRKRTREEIEALEEAARKKAKGKDGGVQRNSSQGSGKLRKDREPDEESGKEKEKSKKGLFGGLFGRKKDKKDKHSSSIGSLEGTAEGRGSEESGRSSSHHSSAIEGVVSPVTSAALQQQQQQQQLNLKNSADPKRLAQQQQQPQVQPPPQQQEQKQPQPQQQPQTPPQPQVSQHASQLRQRDQQQQALYQQYLNRSPSSPPEERLLSTAAGSASGLGLALPTPRPRPGSLVLSPTAVDGQGVGVPELSVIRVFAGKNLQTEATFKTVLLNTSTTSSDLVRQAIQRFRLPAGEDEGDYYLTVKQVEGSSAVLLASEQPLGVFETLVEAAMELPKVKRSSVGSISSVASNLSMHPAIKKLPMNDFTDDSAVKFYLNRRSDNSANDNSSGEEGDDTILAETSLGSHSDSSKQQYLSVSTSNNVTPERFSSPSFRFALQLVIYPDDLPDDMVFDPMTEAIVFKNTLRDRSSSSSTASSGVSQNLRRKIFVFPKNVTVAEVIELGLERFGILEGVVDGGDEVEDKLTKRQSTARVRYGLVVAAGNPERELSPSSKVIDAFPRPPTFRAVERRFPDTKRRSVDSAQLLGTPDDVHPDDPVFILRRAVSYRSSSSRHRHSAPLDEIALQHMHRESASGSSASSDTAAAQGDDTKQRQLSRQEIIAAQRAATRANQKAILSAQTNSVRGVDVLLPGNAMIRSSRYDSADRMRYSYVEPGGESYDISDIIEEEWRESNAASKNDLLEGVLVRNKDGLGEKLDRVLNKIKDGKANARNNTQQTTHLQPAFNSLSSLRSASPSEYSTVDQDNSRSATPVSAGLDARTPTPTSASFTGTQRVASPSSIGSETRSNKSRTTTPTAAGSSKSGASTRRHPSIASVMSDLSGYATPTQVIAGSPSGSPRSATTPKPQRKRPVIPKDDFGIPHMMAIIELGGTLPKAPVQPLHPVDELLFGRPIDENSLHPHVRDIYSSTFKQLQDMDKALDEFLQSAIPTH